MTKGKRMITTNVASLRKMLRDDYGCRVEVNRLSKHCIEIVVTTDWYDDFEMKYENAYDCPGYDPRRESMIIYDYLTDNNINFSEATRRDSRGHYEDGGHSWTEYDIYTLRY